MASEQFIIRTTERSLAFATCPSGEQDVEFETFPFDANVSLAANMSEAFKSSRLLRRANGDILCTIDTPVLLVPTDSFRENEMVQQYLYAFPHTHHATYHYVAMPSMQAVAIFAVSNDLEAVLAKHFSSLYFQPTMASLWTYLSHRHEQTPTRKLYAYFYEHKMHLCSFHNQRFVFANTFRVDNLQDSTCFILGVWQQTTTPGEQAELTLMGRVGNVSAVVDELRKYIQTVVWLAPHDEFPSSSVAHAKDMPFDMIATFV